MTSEVLAFWEPTPYGQGTTQPSSFIQEVADGILDAQGTDFST
jgi:hypothetical protein